MSLKVWLPLLGDFENKGCGDTKGIALTSGNSWATTGKIGAKSLTLTKLQSILGTDSCMSGAKQMSYAFWVKVNTAWKTQWLDGIRWTSTDGSTTQTSRQEFYDNCTHVGTWYRGGSISNVTFVPGQWTHIAATFNYESGKAAFYLNGVLQGTANTISITHYCRGDFYIGDNGTDICENDVRIYDHCLSQAEVHEIAQGLVVHYKLDGAMGGVGENLFSNTQQKIIATSATYASSWETPQFIGDLQDLVGKKITFSYDQYTPGERVNSTTQSNATLAARYGAHLVLNYTPSGGSATQVYPCAGYLNKTTSPLTRVTETYTIPSNCTINSFTMSIQPYAKPAAGNNEIWYIGNFKVEYGSEATSYVPAAVDLGIDTTIIPDSSGYGNNGICVDATTLTGSPRYHNCISCQGASVDTTSNTITGAQFFYCNINMPTMEEITVTWWGKNIAYGRGGILETSNTVQTNTSKGVDYSTTAIASYDSHLTIRNSSATAVDIFSNFTKDGNWHHHAITFDGANVKYYCDSVLKQTSALTGTLPEWKNFCVGLGKAGGVWRQIKQNISDFRIYCTPLLDTDIKLLYNIGMRVDNFGEAHSFEFDEKAIMAPLNDIAQDNYNTTRSYDANTNTYTYICNAREESNQYFYRPMYNRTATNHDIEIGWGQRYIHTAEFYSTKAINITIDYNNNSINTNAFGTVNDNDTINQRLSSTITLPANTWKRVIWGYFNTDETKNPNHLTFYDFSAVYTPAHSDTFTVKIRNIHTYVIDANSNHLQIAREAISHDQFIEDSAHDYASISNKSNALHATNFIEI